MTFGKVEVGRQQKRADQEARAEGGGLLGFEGRLAAALQNQRGAAEHGEDGGVDEVVNATAGHPLIVGTLTALTRTRRGKSRPARRCFNVRVCCCRAAPDELLSRAPLPFHVSST